MRLWTRPGYYPVEAFAIWGGNLELPLQKSYTLTTMIIQRTESRKRFSWDCGSTAPVRSADRCQGAARPVNRTEKASKTSKDNRSVGQALKTKGFLILNEK